jgi:hypothetical protein
VCGAPDLVCDKAPGLGAQPRDALMLTLGQGMKSALIGIAVGLVARPP